MNQAGRREVRGFCQLNDELMENKKHSSVKAALSLWAVFTFKGTVMCFVFIHFVFCVLFEQTLRSLQCRLLL